MRIPKKVKVGAHVIPIRLVPQSELMDGPQELEGYFDPNTMEILILKTLPLSKKQSVLNHEVLHASVYPRTIEAREEEETVLILGETLIEVLRRNPRLLVFILGEDAILSMFGEIEKLVDRYLRAKKEKPGERSAADSKAGS